MRLPRAMAIGLAAALIPAAALATKVVTTLQVSVTVSSSCRLEPRARPDAASDTAASGAEEAVAVSCDGFTPYTLKFDRVADPGIEAQAQGDRRVVSLTF